MRLLVAITPEITMDKEHSSPSTSLIASLRAVQSHEDAPITIPFARLDASMPVTLQMISQNIFPRTPVRIVTATRNRPPSHLSRPETAHSNGSRN